MYNVKYQTAPSGNVQISEISKHEKHTVEFNILHVIWVACWITVNCFALN
jgi:hypothetical protein